jgi:tetratricopeptide (TPR) repeat protein
VLLLTELGKTADAIAAADDYWNKIIDPETAASGLAVLSAKAEAQLAAGDSSAAGDTAKKLMDLDPSGPWGNKGRELQFKLLGTSGATVGPAEMLRVAQSMNDQGKPDQALEACRQTLFSVKGDAKEADVGSQALLLMGQIYRRQERLYEASLVFDTVYERYPKGSGAPSALAYAMDCYRKLNAKEKRPYYKTRMDERGQTLVREFPTHPAVGGLQLGEARGLEEEGKFLEAAQLYRAVPASASGYAEAQMRAGTCLYQQARAIKDKQPEDAKKMFADAEALLVKSQSDIAAAKTKSLDQQVLAGLATAEYTGLTTLSRLYLEDSVNTPEKVLTLLQGVDERFGSDQKAVQALWQLRIRAYSSLGRVDEAVAKFDELYKKPADRAGLAGAASVLSRSLDTRAAKLQEESETSKDSKQADAAMKMWRKAIDMYVISVQPQLDNRQSASATVLEPVAKRLMELGMNLNGVAKDSNTFIGWQPPATLDRGAWDASANIYDVVVEISPADYRARMRQARLLGFLSRWKDAADSYAALFEQEALVKADKSDFDMAVLNAKPELLDAYMEWGVCEAEAGNAEKSETRKARASGIFDLLLKHTVAESPLWWNAKYRQILTFYQRGNYESADVAMNSLVRTAGADFANAPAQLRPLLISLRAEVAKMVHH